MAKEIAVGKRAKISEAQQYMILSVFVAAVFLGVAASLTIRFVNQIMFNIKVIEAEEKSIASYSEVIKSTGICTAPSGSVYSDGELEKCKPDSIELSQIPNTLRANILEKLASNSALNSVPEEGGNNCIDQETGKNYTYEKLENDYKNAHSNTERQAAIQKIKVCSALRIVPDALPAHQNEEALLASLNNIFNMSNWTPESINPSGNNDGATDSNGLHAIGVNLSIEADTATTMGVLNNIERSIREFDINQATIEWSDQGLNLQAKANAYYMDKTAIEESKQVITSGDKNEK